jgi:hypothetical protein
MANKKDTKVDWKSFDHYFIQFELHCASFNQCGQNLTGSICEIKSNLTKSMESSPTPENTKDLDTEVGIYS